MSVPLGARREKFLLVHLVIQNHLERVEIAGGELCYHIKMTQGVEALREGFSSPASFTIGKRIYSLNLEK